MLGSSKDTLNLLTTEPTTGLPNWATFVYFLQNECAPSWWVVAFSIPDYGYFVDDFGIAAGHSVLREVADKLRACEAPRYVAKFGGAEKFLVVIEAEDEKEATRVAEEILLRVTPSLLQWQPCLAPGLMFAPTKREGLDLDVLFDKVLDMHPPTPMPDS